MTRAPATAARSAARCAAASLPDGARHRADDERPRPAARRGRRRAGSTPARAPAANARVMHRAQRASRIDAGGPHAAAGERPGRRRGAAAARDDRVAGWAASASRASGPVRIGGHDHDQVLLGEELVERGGPRRRDGEHHRRARSAATRRTVTRASSGGERTQTSRPCGRAARPCAASRAASRARRECRRDPAPAWRRPSRRHRRSSARRAGRPRSPPARARAGSSASATAAATGSASPGARAPPPMVMGARGPGRRRAAGWPRGRGAGRSRVARRRRDEPGARAAEGALGGTGSGGHGVADPASAWASPARRSARPGMGSGRRGRTWTWTWRPATATVARRRDAWAARPWPPRAGRRPGGARARRPPRPRPPARRPRCAATTEKIARATTSDEREERDELDRLACAAARAWRRAGHPLWGRKWAVAVTRPRPTAGRTCGMRRETRTSPVGSAWTAQAALEGRGQVGARGRGRRRRRRRSPGRRRARRRGPPRRPGRRRPTGRPTARTTATSGQQGDELDRRLAGWRREERDVAGTLRQPGGRRLRGSTRGLLRKCADSVPEAQYVR